MKQDIPQQTVRKRYLTSEVAANFIHLLHDMPADFLPSSCDFMVDSFNSKLRSTLDSIAPPKLKKIVSYPTPPWINEEIKKLKRNCRIAERRWRKNKLTINHNIYHEQLVICNKAIKQSRQAHFSKLISDNRNNPKILFSTIDRLINPVFINTNNTSSNTRCEEFAAHFNNKIDTIRSTLSHCQTMDFNTREPLFAGGEALEKFVLVDAEMLGKIK